MFGVLAAVVAVATTSLEDDFSRRNEMARDKAKDDLMFNCSQEHELTQVASHYGPDKERVSDFLKKACAKGDIHRFTHAQVYQLIKEKLGLAVPV
jgi:hypothetical protein